MAGMELSIMDYFTEEHLEAFLEAFRALGPLPGILLTFLKSFIPPLPTLVIVGANAAIYGMWAGFLYSWIGLVSGCLLTFSFFRWAAGTSLMRRWSDKLKVQKLMGWAQKNGFSFVFLLSILPVGPFVLVNMAAGLTRMQVSSYAAAVALGKAVMVFCVSYIGTNLADFMEQPLKLVGVALFIAVSLWLNRRLQAYFASSVPVTPDAEAKIS